MTNHYQVLGVPVNATPEQIKAAYREYAKHYHPDKHSNNEFFKRRFQDVQNAYEVLCDDAKRAAFDRQQTNGQQGNGQAKSTYDSTVSQLNSQIAKLKSDLAIKERLASEAAKNEQNLASKVESLQAEIVELSNKQSGQGNDKKTSLVIGELKLALAVVSVVLVTLVVIVAFKTYKSSPHSPYLSESSKIDMNYVSIRMDSLDAHKNYAGAIMLVDSLLHSGTGVDTTVEHNDGFYFENTDLLLHRAYGKYRLNNDTGAVRDLTLNILSRRVPIAYPYWMRCIIKQKMGDLIGAHADINRALTIDPKDVRSRNERANMLYNSKEFVAALKDYKVVVNKNSHDGDVMYWMGNCYQELNQPDSACIMWRRAGDLGSKDAFESIKTSCK